MAASSSSASAGHDGGIPSDEAASKPLRTGDVIQVFYCRLPALSSGADVRIKVFETKYAAEGDPACAGRAALSALVRSGALFLGVVRKAGVFATHSAPFATILQWVRAAVRAPLCVKTGRPTDGACACTQRARTQMYEQQPDLFAEFQKSEGLTTTDAHAEDGGAVEDDDDDAVRRSADNGDAGACVANVFALSAFKAAPGGRVFFIAEREDF